MQNIKQYKEMQTNQYTQMYEHKKQHRWKQRTVPMAQGALDPIWAQESKVI